MSESNEMDEANHGPKGTMTFACGARFVGVPDPTPIASHKATDGRCRWVVYDSEPGPQRPKLGEDVAPCRFGCPCKRAAKRKEWKGFPPEESTARWQIWITCYGKWMSAAQSSPAESPARPDEEEQTHAKL